MSVPVTILEGESLSNAVDLGIGEAIVGVLMPGNGGGPGQWTTADITFQASLDGVTFRDVYTSTGVELALAVVDGGVVAFFSQLIGLPPIVKVRSGTAATPVAQSATQVVTLLTQAR